MKIAPIVATAVLGAVAFIVIDRVWRGESIKPAPLKRLSEVMPLKRLSDVNQTVSGTFIGNRGQPVLRLG